MYNSNIPSMSPANLVGVLPKVTMLLTQVEPPRTEIEKLEQRVTLYGFAYNMQTGEIGNSMSTTVRLPRHHVGTYTDKPEHSVAAIDRYKLHLINELGRAMLARAERLGEENLPPQTLPADDSKLYHSKLSKRDVSKLLFELQRLERIRTDPDMLAQTIVDQKTSTHSTVNAYTSYSSSKATHSHLRSDFKYPAFFTDQVSATMQLGGPFSVVAIENNQAIPIGNASLESLLKAPAAALDYETKNWKEINRHAEFKSWDNAALFSEYTRLLAKHNLFVDPELIAKKRREDLVTDIHTILNDNRGEALTTGIYVDLARGYNYLVTTFAAPMSELEIDLPQHKDISGKYGDKAKFKIIYVKDSRDVKRTIDKLFQIHDPLFVFGHNHMKFDYKKSEELNGEKMATGVAGKHSPIKGQDPQGFIVHKSQTGRMDIDGSFWSQFFGRNYNNKLDTVFTYVTGLREKKDITHDELDVLTRIADSASDTCTGADLEKAHDAIRTILKYAAADGIKSFVIGDHARHEHILFGKVFDSRTARSDVRSITQLGIEYQYRRLIKQKGALPRNWFEDMYLKNPLHISPQSDDEQVDSQLKPQGVQSELNLELPLKSKTPLLEPPTTHKLRFKLEDYTLRDYVRRELQNRGVSTRSRRTWTNGVWFELFPMQKIFGDVIAKEPNVKSLIDAYANESNAWKNARIAKILESLTLVPFAKVILGHDPREFSTIFGLPQSKTVINEYAQQLSASFDTVADVLRKTRILNYNGEAFLLPHEGMSQAIQLEQAGYGVIVGTGPVASVGPRKFLGTIDDRFVMLGIADFKSNKGFRSKIEKQVSTKFIDALFIERDATLAFQIIDESIKRFLDGKLTLDERSVEKRKSRHALQYSGRSPMKIVGGPLVDGLSEGQVDIRPYSSEEIFKTMFGGRGSGDDWEDGTLTSIIHAGLPFVPSKPHFDLLKELYEGQATETDVNEIADRFSREVNVLTNGTARLSLQRTLLPSRESSENNIVLS